MQDPKDESKFCVVERFEQESSLQIHRANPVRDFKTCHVGLTRGLTDQFWKTFVPYVSPRLVGEMDLTRWEEM
jgi:hypothetical protein